MAGVATVLGLVLVLSGATLGWLRVGSFGFPSEMPNGLAVGPGGTPEGTLALSDIEWRALADNMFNHVVDAASAGDSAALGEFLGPALEAYAQTDSLDMDGLFHLSTLQRLAARPEEALRTARAILSVSPGHLLGLGAAAGAAADLARDDLAAEYLERLEASYEDESARGLSEYAGHASFIAQLRTGAPLPTDG